MSQFRDADEVLTFAVRLEEEAAQFYEEQAEKMNRPEMRKVFLDFAKEEMVHKAKLLAIKRGELPMNLPQQKVMNLKIAEYYSKAPPVGPHMSYAEMLMVAMLKEKEAFKLYTDLAEAVENESLRTVFQILANEEAKHKLRFELEYDQEVYSEN
jgi:rubrerythrin